MSITRSVRAIAFALCLVGASIASAGPASAQDEDLPMAPEQPSATYGSAIADAALVYIEIYYRMWVFDPQLDVYLQDGVAFETVVQCTGFGVAQNHVITASHCIQTDVEAGTVPYDIIAGAATDWAFDVGLYPGLTRDDIRALGLATWEVEGDTANSPPEREVFVSYGVVQSGLQGQNGTSTARLVDHIPIDQGDVALISIQDPGSLAPAPVPIIEVAEGTPAVGSEILSLGYPGAVGDVTTGIALAPSIQDGRIGAVTTTSFGGYQVFEVSSTIGSGMSGGPTVNFSGQAVGVNSFVVLGNFDTFKFVSPADRFVGELLARNGVVNELSRTDITYRQAVTLFLAGNYTDAIELFDDTLQRMPAHRQAQEFRLDAVRLRDEVGDSVVAPPVTEVTPQLAPVPLVDTAASESDDGNSILPFALIGLGLVAIAGAAFLALRRTRPAATPQAGGPGALPGSTGPVGLPPVIEVAEAASVAPAQHGVTEELERLSNLHQAGELTDEEFAEFKHQLFHSTEG